MEIFKARCSSLGTIKQISSLTDKQLATLNELLVKDKRTYKQEQTMNDLKFRHENPTLMEGSKTLLKEWYALKLGRDRDYSFVKEIQKGLIMEDAAIELCDEVLFGGVGLVKNTESKSNDYIEGTCDVIYDDLVIDIKCPWNTNTFLSNAIGELDKNYIWQLKAYAILYNKPRAVLSYCLVDTPTWAALQANHKRVRIDRIEFESTYDHIENHKKVLSFEIPILESDEKEIEQAVKLCRDFLAEYDAEIKSKLGNIIEL